jgi:hypothetical protein
MFCECVKLQIFNEYFCSFFLLPSHLLMRYILTCVAFTYVYADEWMENNKRSKNFYGSQKNQLAVILFPFFFSFSIYRDLNGRQNSRHLGMYGRFQGFLIWMMLGCCIKSIFGKFNTMNLGYVSFNLVYILDCFLSSLTKSKVICMFLT